MKIVIATRNSNKARELKECLSDLKLDVMSLADFPDIPEVIEDGTTFRDNAVKKAVTNAAGTGLLTLADDSGLEVHYLNDKPGVYSARYAGENATDRENNEKLLDELKEAVSDQRRARFVCCIALANKEGLINTVQGVVEGELAAECRGTQGFGYDPLFIKDSYNKTFAELPLEVKNRISHRALALQKAKLLIEKYMFKTMNG